MELRLQTDMDDFIIIVDFDLLLRSPTFNAFTIESIPFFKFTLH